MALTPLLFWIIYIGGVSAALVNPVIGVMLYILVYHLNPETQWWGSSVTQFGLRTSFIVALATGVGMAIRPLRFAYHARQFGTTYGMLVLFALVALGSLVWGLDASRRSEYQAEKLIKLVIILFILIRCVQTPLAYQAVLLSWLLGVAYLGYQATGGAGSTIAGRLTIGIGGPDFAESSGLAVHMVATLPLLGAMFFISRTWWGRGFALVVGALVVNTIVMTRTRNAIVGLAALSVVMVLSMPARFRLRGIAGVVVALVLAMQLTDPGWWERMHTISEFQTDQSAVQRLAFWQAALSIVSDHPLGVGLGNFHIVIMDYVPGLTVRRSAHNTLVTCLAETGWLGLALLLAAIASALWQLGRIRRLAHELPAFEDLRFFGFHTRFHLGWHAAALRAALVGYLGCAMFTTRLTSEDFWLLLGLAACLWNVCCRQLGLHAEAHAERGLAAPRAPAAPLAHGWPAVATEGPR